MALTLSPLEEYTRRRAARAEAYTRFSRREALISYGRLAAVAGTALFTWLAFVHDGPFSLPVWSPLVPMIAFVAMAVWHDRVLRAADCMTRATTFYDDGIARLEDRWQGTGDTGARFLDEDHLYAGDLDIFGPGSLFQLLSRARTQLGEDLLARWLTAPAPAAAVRLRQDAVAELRGQLDFREALATAGGRLARDQHHRAERVGVGHAGSRERAGSGSPRSFLASRSS